MGRATFDGSTFDPAQDAARLTSQLLRVKALMIDGRWRTLAAIREQTGGTEAAISARLRDFRKDRFGGWAVERQRLTNTGLWEYRLVPNSETVKTEPAPQMLLNLGQAAAKKLPTKKGGKG